MENDQRNKLIKSLRAKINFGHPIYLWELLLVVKYILQEGNISILNEFKPYRLPDCEPIGICTALRRTLSKLYVLQTIRTKLLPTCIIQHCTILHNAGQDQSMIMNTLARIYHEVYDAYPPSPYQFWFETTEERLKFLDIAIKRFKDSKEYYIFKGKLVIKHLHNF